MSEDDQKFWEEAVQEITDKAIKDIDAALDQNNLKLCRFELRCWFENQKKVT